MNQKLETPKKNKTENPMRKVKIEKAFSFLIETNISISEISDICGFSDQSHMIKIFKAYIGFLPNQIRSL